MNMWSTNFNRASKESYYLVNVRHGERGQGNQSLIEFVLRQMKLSISLFGAMLFYIYAAYIPYSPSVKNISDVADPFVGSILVFCFSLFASSAYTGTYDMIIRSVVHCNFMDEEMFVGEQKFTEPFFDELMGYWKKADEDDKLNAAANQTKKKDILKENIELDGLYKSVPEGDQDIERGPSSDEDNGMGQDMFTENKKARQNRDQDFDEDFLKKPLTKVLEQAKQHKPLDTDNDADAEIMADPEDEEMGRESKVKVENNSNVLNNLPSDQSFELDDQPKKVVVIKEAEPDDEDVARKVGLRVIHKNASAKHLDDDAKSIVSKKSALSRKRKFGLKVGDNDSNAKEIDDGKSMKSGNNKKTSKLKILKKPESVLQPPLQFKASDEPDDEDYLKPSYAKGAEKLDDKPKVMLFKPEDDETKTLKVSVRSRNSSKSNSKSPIPNKPTLNEKNKNSSEVQFKAKENDDEDAKSSKSKKSLKRPISKSPITNKSDVTRAKPADDDFDNKSAKLSMRSKKNVNFLTPATKRDTSSKSPQLGRSSEISKPAPQQPLDGRKKFQSKFEGDDFEGVVDKNHSIEILNASQGSLY